MTERIKAIVAREADGRTRASLEEIELTELPAAEVLVSVSHSTLNYKDGLAVSGKGKICRSLPMVCGIDLAGTVIDSASPHWKTGDRVLVNGFGLSEKYWGGYAQKARLKPEWLVRIPDSFSCEQAMAIGTAGYTSMLCVHAIQDHGVKPSDGPVLVTGAAGFIGSTLSERLVSAGHAVTGIVTKE